MTAEELMIQKSKKKGHAMGCHHPLSSCSTCSSKLVSVRVPWATYHMVEVVCCVNMCILQTQFYPPYVTAEREQLLDFAQEILMMNVCKYQHSHSKVWADIVNSGFDDANMCVCVREYTYVGSYLFLNVSGKLPKSLRNLKIWFARVIHTFHTKNWAKLNEHTN